jgi:hypothetical protein
VSEPVAKIEYEGALQVRSYRRGTYLGDAHLEQVIERALAGRYGFGKGWSGYGVVSIELYDEPLRRDQD